MSDSRITQRIEFKRTNFIESTQKLFLNEETADFHFLLSSNDNEIRIPAHKLIVAKDSEAFKKMFYSAIHNNFIDTYVSITDTTSEAFEEFLKFFYFDHVVISRENIIPVMSLANKYKVKDLVTECLKYFDQNENQLIENQLILAYELAIHFNRAELKEKCKQKIKESPKRIFATNEFRICSREALKNILEIDNLMCDPIDVFNACIEWAKEISKQLKLDPTMVGNLKKVLGECFYLIPFAMMTSQEVLRIAYEQRELFDRDELIDLMVIMSSDGPVTLDKFITKSYLPFNSIEDDIDHELKWSWMTKLPNEKKQWISQQEVTSIPFQIKDTLVAIKLSMIFHNETEKSKFLSGNLIISQRGANNSDILLKQPIKIQCYKPQHFSLHEKIKLIKPIEIRPGTYDFKIDFDSSWKNHSFFTKRDIDDFGIVKFICY